MTQPDLELCSQLLRNISDEILKNAPRGASDQSMSALIDHVRAVSGAAVRRLRTLLTESYPDIGWVDEEERPTEGDYWLCDPIDGAYHYLQGLPLWSSSLALVRDGRPVLSVVHDATRGETYAAGKGKGATCNGVPLRVSPKSDLVAAVVGTAIPPLAQVGKAEQDEALAMLSNVARSVFVVRPMAAVSLQLAYVAAGRLDGYWENGRDVADWLAGSLLVREAGGLVSHLDGAEFGWSGDGIIAGNDRLHPEIRAVLGR